MTGEKKAREIEAIESAIRATEYKYFGDYEMSDDQREAVDQLVLTAQHRLAALQGPSSGEGEGRQIPDHAWRYLVEACKRERLRLTELGDVPGNMLPMVAAWDSLNEIECMIPVEFWPDHESVYGGDDPAPDERLEITIRRPASQRPTPAAATGGDVEEHRKRREAFTEITGLHACFDRQPEYWRSVIRSQADVIRNLRTERANLRKGYQRKIAKLERWLEGKAP